MENTNSQDIIIDVFPAKSEFSIDQIRQIIREIKISHQQTRVYILHGFDNSSLEAQNSFLKTLEEPPSKVRFIISIANIHRLQPTIISRSKIITLEKVRTELKSDNKVSNVLKDFVDDNNLQILNDNNFQPKSKDEALQIINNLIVFFRKRLQSDNKATRILKEILRIRGLLENNNLNNQLATDHLLLYIKKTYH